MRYFNKKRFTMRQVVGLLTMVFLGISAIAYAVNITYTFSSGSPIRASEMNQNFTDVKNAIDALEAKNAGLLTSADVNFLVGKAFWGVSDLGSRWAVQITFTTKYDLSILLTDTAYQATYSCNYLVGEGFINLYRCDYDGTGNYRSGIGILTDVKFFTVFNTGKKAMTGLSLLGNSAMNAQLPYLSHFQFTLQEQ